MSVNQSKDITPTPIEQMFTERNTPIIPKYSFNEKSKEKDDNCKKKFSYIHKNYNTLNRTENFNKSKNIQKVISKGEISPIFEEKKFSHKNNSIIITNDRNNSKSNILIFNNTKRILPPKYQFNLDSNNNNIFYLNSRIYIGNRIKSLNRKSKKNLSNIKEIYNGRRIITKGEISCEKRNKLKKYLSKPNYTNYNNNYNITNLIYSDSNETFTPEKMKNINTKFQTIQNIFKSCKNNQNKSDLNQKIKKSNLQTYTYNMKNDSQLLNNQKNSYNISNLPKEYKIDKRGNYKELKDLRNQESKSKNKKNSVNIQKKKINNNSININNVYINFSDKNTLVKEIKEDLNNINSYSQINNKSSKNSKKDLNLNHNQILKDIKQLWKKVGGITEEYKIFFKEQLIYLNDNDKLYFYQKEKEDLIKVLDILDKLNNDINIRNSINFQLKNLNIDNTNIKIEEISKLLISLRKSAIDVINDFINFKKEISYDLINNKYILYNINNYPYKYLYQIENDTSYLSSHEFLSNLYKFNKYSDPFLLTPSKENKDNNFYILPLSEKGLQEIKNSNYFLIKEKINKEQTKRNLMRTPNNYCNNSILIRNSNIVNKNDDKIKILTKRDNKFDNIKICHKISHLSIYNDKMNIFRNNNKLYKNSYLDLENNRKYFDYSNTKICSFVNNFEINNNKVKNENGIKKKKIEYLIHCSKTAEFEIINNKDIKDNQSKNKILIFPNNSNTNIINDVKLIESKSIFKTSSTDKFQNNNNSQLNKESIPQNINHQTLRENSICPFNKEAYPQIELIYNNYLKTVNDDIKISFKISPNIYYYSTIGVAPKIILFKQNDSILYGLATLSYDPSKLFQRALMITSISCSKNYSIIETLLQLVDYCDREIEYDELILSLYFYQSETEKDKYILNEEFQNMIKTKTKFKWTALENTGNERKIKYHYKKSFSSNKNSISKDRILTIVRNYTQIRFYRFIKYNKISCEKGFNAYEYTLLFNILDVILKYGKDPSNNNDELNALFSKISGLKKKRLLKMISEFNYVIYNNVETFVEQLRTSEDKKINEVLYQQFIPLIQEIERDKFLGLYYCDISTNFSNIFKKRINGFEYNIISLENYNIEVFKLFNEKDSEDYLYFFKSENEKISFILYELNHLNEIEIDNNNNELYKNDLFNEILKKILIKDNEEPAKYYKKIAIPSFRYHPWFEKEQQNRYKFGDYEVLDGDDWFDFCIENNTRECVFSFPEKNNINNEDVKIINNSFIIGIINLDLTVDYNIPVLNIYYISKNCWIKR